MLEKVTEGDLAIFKNGEEHKVKAFEKREEDVCLMFDGPVQCQIRDSTAAEYWTYRYNGEWDGDLTDRNDIVKVVHIEKDDVS